MVHTGGDFTLAILCESEITLMILTGVVPKCDEIRLVKLHEINDNWAQISLRLWISC